jgi:dihydrofolate synthase/folylpolyglutamate synthase
MELLRDMESGTKAYREAIRYLYRLQKFGIKFGLSKTSNLLKKLGNPHEGRRFVHVAGTNGKGSVAAMLGAILEETGWKVGFYSSPHLVRFTERFRVNGKEITQRDVVALVNELKGVMSRKEPPTFFEATTAMALAYFARENTDIDIMEVGMGGRLDATNVIRPEVCVITNISLEHREFLGDTLTAIAREKAGIIKKGIEVVTAETRRKVINEFEIVCRQKDARLLRVGKDVRYRKTAKGFNYYGCRRLKGLELSLAGKYQTRNAATALAVLEVLETKGRKVSEEHIRRGLSRVKWPGRMQVVGTAPAIVLDGAHNPSAMRALTDSLQLLFEFRRLILVLGVMADKAIDQILREILPHADYVLFTRPVYYRAAEPQLLAEKASRFRRPGEVVSVLSDALDRARELADKGDLIVVCGSLFTVGEAMTYFDPQSYRPDEVLQ